MAPSPTVNLTFRNLRQENDMFKARLHSKFEGGLGYMVEPCHRSESRVDQIQQGKSHKIQGFEASLVNTVSFR